MDERVVSRPGSSVNDWVYYCERCGQQMEEQKCKIVCLNCGLTRDCSDP